MHDERASLCFLTMIQSLLDAVAQSVERPFKGPSLVQLYRLTWVRIPWETISYYAAAWELGIILAAPSGYGSDMKLRSLGKAEGKNPAWQKMASVLSDHIFTKTVDFQIFRSSLESLFEPLIETFSSYNKKLSWPNPLSCSVMRPKKRLWITIRPKWSQADILTRRRRQQWQ